MPALAIPILIPFAEAAGITINAVASAAGLDLLSKKVEEYIEDNPEQSQKIFAMIMPEQGIANVLKNKSSEGDEEVSETETEEVEVEEKPKLSGREKGMRIKEAINRARAGKGNYSSPDAEGPSVDIRGSVIREVEDMGIADPDLKDNYKPSGYTGWKRFANKGRKKYAEGGIANLATGATPYDSRATTQDFANAIDRVGAGNDLQKAVAIGEYGQNVQRQNPFKNLGFFDTQRHFDNNQLLKNAVTRGELSNADYNKLGGFDVAQTMGAGNLVLGGIGNLIGSTGHNIVQSFKGDQSPFDIPGDVFRNVQGGTGLISDDLKAQYERIINPTQTQDTGITNIASPRTINDGSGGKIASSMPQGSPGQLNPTPTPDASASLTQYSNIPELTRLINDNSNINSLAEANDYLKMQAAYEDFLGIAPGQKYQLRGNEISLEDFKKNVYDPNKQTLASGGRAGYANVGGIASMMQPKRAGYAMGGMLSNLITSSPQILSQVNSNSQNNSNWWDTLDAQGMNVYNSMKRGGHDDSTIQDQLSMLGYYDPNTTPPDSTPDIPVVSPRNIINNGGNDKGGITAARPGLGYKGPGSTVSGNFNIEDIGEGTVDSDDLSFGLSLKEGIFGLQRMLGNIPTPLNLALKAANKFKNYRADKKAAAEEAAAANRAEANRISNRLANEYSAQQQRDGRDFSVSGPDTSANPTGKSNQASSERGYSLHGKKGGFVPTGLATMFRRKR